MKNVILPESIRYFRPIQDEISFALMEGCLEKSLHRIRKTILSSLKPDLRRMRSRNTRNNLGMIQRRYRLFEYDKIQRITTSITSYIGRIVEIKATGDTSQNAENAIANYEEAISTQLGYLSEDMQTTLFGGTGIESVRNIIDEGEEHRSRRMEYIRNKIEELRDGDRNFTNAASASKLQKLYKEDPKRCLSWRVTADTSPSCTIPMEVVEEHFTSTWSISTQYDHNEMWSLPKLIEDEDSKIFEDIILDESLIKSTIISRDPNSAAGPDSISFGVLRSCPNEMSTFLRRLFNAILINQKVPSTWKTSRTVLIYKKADPENPENWSPISISSCLYRAFMIMMMKAFEIIDNMRGIISPEQKGFKKVCNGCNEHITLVNELLQHAIRSNENIILTTTDFANAFGTVHHKHIFSMLRDLGIPEAIIKVLRSSYVDASTNIDINGRLSRDIKIRRGVRQGYPMSPMLFNICIEPLIRRIKSLNIGTTVADINCSVQAYADDIILVSPNEQTMQVLLDTTASFCSTVKMELAATKCHTYSYILERGRRIQSDLAFTINGEATRSHNLFMAMEYLGSSVALMKRIKMSSVEKLLSNVELEIKRIGDSQLLLNQKIDAIKRFEIPKLDYALSNNVVSLNKLRQLDQLIRNTIASHLQNKNVPRDAFYTHWADGGFGIPELYQSHLQLQTKSYFECKFSKMERTRNLMDFFEHEEIRYRGLSLASEHQRFGNILEDEDGNLVQSFRRGTNCTFIRAITASRKLGIGIKFDDNQAISIEDLRNHLEPVTVTGPKAINSVIKTICNESHRRSLYSLPLHGHSFRSCHDSPESNSFLSNPIRLLNDNIQKFTLLARANILPTHEILALSQNIPNKCERCSSTENDSLMHRLNNCPPQYAEYTKRHNCVVTIVSNLIRETRRPYPILHSSQTITLRNLVLPPSLSRLKPDLWFLEPELNKLTVVEVTIPYGSFNEDGVSTLATRRSQKLEKYQELISFIRDSLRIKVEYYVIIVSSLGAVPKDTIRDLKKLARSQKRTSRYARLCSEAALAYSCTLFWRSLDAQNHHRTPDDDPDSHDSAHSSSDDEEDSIINELFDVGSQHS